MEPTYLKEYESPYSYRLYDVYRESLLLRHEGGPITGGDIDLIFLGVKYVELSTVLNGVRISKPSDEHAISLENKYAPDSFSDPGTRLYAIDSESYRFHIIASNLWIHVCKDHTTESSLIPISGYRTTGSLAEYDNYFIKHVKEWYKLE